MKKSILLIITLAFLNACAEYTALVGPTYTMAKSGSIVQTGTAYASSYGIKKTLGQSPGEYVTSLVRKNYKIDSLFAQKANKSALEASVKYLARDLGTKGIRVNAISAGPIKTLAASAIGDAKFLYKWNEDHSLLKRNVNINDVGSSAVYLISDLASAVTGEIHYVDAGYNKVGMPNPKNIT